MCPRIKKEQTKMNFKQLKRTWIVAEIGVNHEGNEDLAADLIRKAAKSGVDAVKFQTYTPEHYVSIEQADNRLHQFDNPQSHRL